MTQTEAFKRGKEAAINGRRLYPEDVPIEVRPSLRLGYETGKDTVPLADWKQLLAGMERRDRIIGDLLMGRYKFLGRVNFMGRAEDPVSLYLIAEQVVEQSVNGTIATNGTIAESIAFYRSLSGLPHNLEIIALLEAQMG